MTQIAARPSFDCEGRALGARPPPLRMTQSLRSRSHRSYFSLYRPIFCVPESTNHTFPSGPGATSIGAECAAGITYSLNTPFTLMLANDEYPALTVSAIHMFRSGPVAKLFRTRPQPLFCELQPGGEFRMGKSSNTLGLVRNVPSAPDVEPPLESNHNWPSGPCANVLMYVDWLKLNTFSTVPCVVTSTSEPLTPIHAFPS